MIHPRPADYALLAAVSPLCLYLGAWLTGLARCLITIPICAMCRLFPCDWSDNPDGQACVSRYKPRRLWYPHGQ